MTNQLQITNNKTKREFDLEVRTTKFSVGMLTACSKVPVTLITKPIIEQVVRSATSIGANYREANGCDSKKDFKNKLSICKKEAKETMYWIHILSTFATNQKDELRILWKEVHELSLIFAAIINKL